MEKIDLFNTRYDPRTLVPNPREFDSCEDRQYDTTLKIGKRANELVSMPFKSCQPRLAKENIGCGSGKLDFTIVDRNGGYFEVSKKLEHKKLQKFSETVAHSNEFQGKKDRLDCPTMNRIMDNLHDMKGDEILTRLKENKIRGSEFSMTKRPDLCNPATHLGPGDYDITRCEQHRLDRRMQQFSMAPSGRGAEEEYPSFTMHDFRRVRREWKGLDAENQNTFQLRNSKSTGEMTSKSMNEAITGAKFSQVNRWKTPLYKTEKYIKTTGLSLSLDWDKAMDKRIPFSLNDTSKRGSGVAGGPSESANVDIDVDCGSKATVKTIVKNCQIKYAAAFKSTAEVGMHVPIPASGTGGGPGAFPGVYKSTLRIREPNKRSAFFLKDRVLLEPKIAAPDILAELKPSTAPRGGQFNEAGKAYSDNMRNVHMQEFAKKKISKIYPRLARKKYEEVLTLDEMLATIPID